MFHLDSLVFITFLEYFNVLHNYRNIQLPKLHILPFLKLKCIKSKRTYTNTILIQLIADNKKI